MDSMTYGCQMIYMYGVQMDTIYGVQMTPLNKTIETIIK